MQGHKRFVNKVVLRFQLSERVPPHNLYRRLSELLDWDFLYAQTQPFSSHTGQPSLDPVVFPKLRLVNRLENLVSDRRSLSTVTCGSTSSIFWATRSTRNYLGTRPSAAPASSTPPPSSNTYVSTSLPSAWPPA